MQYCNNRVIMQRKYVDELKSPTTNMISRAVFHNSGLVIYVIIYAWPPRPRRLWLTTCWWIMAPLYKSMIDWSIDGQGWTFPRPRPTKLALRPTYNIAAHTTYLLIFLTITWPVYYEAHTWQQLKSESARWPMFTPVANGNNTRLVVIATVFSPTRRSFSCDD